MKQSKRKTAFRAVKMSLQIKSRLSKAVLILGIPAAFLPALIAKGCRHLQMNFAAAKWRKYRCLLSGAVVSFGDFFPDTAVHAGVRQYTDEEDQVRGTRELKRTL